MFRIEDDERTGTLEQFIKHKVTSALEPGDGNHTQIKSMQSTFMQISRTPETIRVMTQLDFKYQGVIDPWDTTRHMPPEDEVLAVDWWDSTFVVVPHGDPGVWCEKACREAAAGRTVVMLLPARTNTRWFHRHVLQQAGEIRFIQGMVWLTGASQPNTFPDCIAIYNRVPCAPRRKEGAVAIIKLQSSFTKMDVDVDVDVDDDNSESGESEEEEEEVRN